MANDLVNSTGGVYQLATINPKELREIITSNVGADGVNAFDLARVRIPTGAALSWTVPSVEGEETLKELSGIIVYQRNIRSYWSTKFGEGGPASPPECSSEDAITGHGDPGGACAACPLNEWGSAGDGKKGKACRELKLVFMVREQEYMPIVLVLAPMSIPAAKRYFMGLASRAIKYHAVVTAWTLERAQSSGGIAYARAVPRLLRRLSPEEHAMVAENTKTIQSALANIRIEERSAFESSADGEA